MDRTSTVWQRLLDYREELTDVCDEVTWELIRNRRRREEWHLRTLHWKQNHLIQTPPLKPTLNNQKEDSGKKAKPDQDTP